MQPCLMSNLNAEGAFTCRTMTRAVQGVMKQTSDEAWTRAEGLATQVARYFRQASTQALEKYVDGSVL